MNRRTPANFLIANSSEPHVVLNVAASLRHIDFATQFLVHIPQLCWRLIALAYEWNVLRTAFALRQTFPVHSLRGPTGDYANLGCAGQIELAQGERKGLTALGNVRASRRRGAKQLPCVPFKARRSWASLFCTGLTTQKRYDCSAAFPCTEVLCTNSTSARLYFLNVL